jgi:cytochrome P450
MTVAWSSGRYHDDEVAKAGVEPREYLESQVIRSRHAGTSGGLIDVLAQEDSASRLTDTEIVMLSMGLLMAGAETTGSHLALGLIEVLERLAWRTNFAATPARFHPPSKNCSAGCGSTAGPARLGRRTSLSRR